MRRLWHPVHWHPSWQPILKAALGQMDQSYLQHLQATLDWLPGAAQIFNAFRLPLPEVRYILFGESPYPRAISANGYAFWDASVGELWSPTGLSKAVNRATSLRNFIKLLLLADGKLSPKNVSGSAIAAIDKSHLVQTLPELFEHLLAQGFLLLNATLAWHSAKTVRDDARAWQPFMHSVLTQLYAYNPDITLVLFGNFAQQAGQAAALPFKRICAEHPYNISFIQNEKVKAFFAPLQLLEKGKE